MAKVLDFNILQQPTQVVRMMDDDKTIIHLSAPTVDLVDELRNNAAQLEAALSGKSEDTRQAVYNLAARLINCNLDGVIVTPEELAVKYRMSLQTLGIFFDTYVDFIGEIGGEKN